MTATKRKSETVTASTVKEPTAQDFVKAYTNLCEKYKFRLTANPVWKLRDDGTFSLTIQFGVEKAPSQTDII